VHSPWSSPSFFAGASVSLSTVPSAYAKRSTASGRSRNRSRPLPPWCFGNPAAGTVDFSRPGRLIVPFPDSKSDIAGVCPTSTQEIEVRAAPPVKGAKAIRIRIKFCLGPLAFEVWVLADLMSRHGRLHSQESTVRLHHRINTGTSDIDRIVTLLFWDSTRFR
jgi:hypothetical protein